MAASLSRPDPSSPASVAEAGFTTARRGFAQDEVRAFLTSVAAELSRLKERERQLEAQLEMAPDEVPVAAELDDETVTNLLGEETLRVLQTARESASQIKVRAEEAAAVIVREASDEANRMRQEVEVETARRRHDATSDAEAELALAKQQGREMVNEARAYRERVLGDLERRTKLARQQIEDLVHGRDRLLQVFERARLVAVDVTSELQSIDGPEEIVNLSPTTGPLPIMVPAGEIERSAEHRRDTVVDDGVDPTADDSIATANPLGADVADLAMVVEDAVVDDITADNDAESATDDASAADDASADVPAVTPADQPASDGTSADAVDDADDGNEDEDDGDDVPAVVDDEPGVHAEASADDVDDSEDDSENDGATPSKQASDANVVSLFRGRAEPGSAVGVADGSAADDTSDAEQASDDKPDVDDIFERLRSEAPELTTNDAPADIDAPADDLVDETTETPGEAAEDVSEDTPGDLPDEAAQELAEEATEPTPFSRRDEVIVPLIVAGARKLKRVLADEQNAVLDRLRQNEAVVELGAIVSESDAHIASYTDALADDLMSAAVAGAAEVGVNDTKRLRTSLIKGDALTPAHDLLRDDLVIPLRERLERAISDGGGDNDAITKKVRAVYRQWKTQHIDDQLDDVFRFAHGGGLMRAAKTGTKLTWTIDPAEPTCPDCEDNSLAGPVPAREPYPTGHTAAPAPPGCHCLTVPTSS